MEIVLNITYCPQLFLASVNVNNASPFLAEVCCSTSPHFIYKNRNNRYRPIILYWVVSTEALDLLLLQFLCVSRRIAHECGLMFLLYGNGVKTPASNWLLWRFSLVGAGNGQSCDGNNISWPLGLGVRKMKIRAIISFILSSEWYCDPNNHNGRMTTGASRSRK
jgi:hypothetical protein